MKKKEPLTESYFYILLCLYGKANHGYGIMQETKRLSQGTVNIGSGTMYGATSNMIKKGWIKESQKQSDELERKRCYELTNEGEIILTQEIERLEGLVNSAKQVMKGVL